MRSFIINGAAYTAPDPIGVGYQDTAELALKRIFRQWQKDNPEDYADLQAGAAEIGRAVWAAQRDRYAAEGDHKRAEVMAGMIAAADNGRLPEEMMFGTWREGMLARHPEVRRALLRILLTPTKDAPPTDDAYMNGVREEVDSVINFFAQTWRPNIEEPPMSSVNGTTPSAPDSDTITSNGVTGEATPTPTLSPMAMADGSGSTSSQAPTLSA